MLVAAMTIGLMIAACGSSKPSSTAKSAQYATDLKYSGCVRSHGVSNFPDPTPGGGIDIRSLGTETQSPTFVSAQTACAKLQPGGSRRPSPFTGEQKQQMVAKAHCIRTHGVPNFPDPTTVGPGTFGERELPSGWNPGAPAVVKATNACAHVGIAIPSPDGAVG